MMQLVERLLTLDRYQVNGNDWYAFLKYGAIGFVGFGAYQVGTRMIKRDLDAAVDFVIPVECVPQDRILCSAFVDLQEYIRVNEWLFKCALVNCDHLMFLERALLQGSITPTRNDKVIAFSHFRLAATRLKMFQISVHEKLGASHAALVNILIRRIYGQLQIHFTNVLHVCKQFHPDQLLKEARRDIDAWEKRTATALAR